MENTNLIFLLLAFFTGLTVFASPKSTTFQMKIMKPSGTAMDAAAVSFQFTTYSPTGNCVLYVEQFNALSMANSGGLAVINLGSGTQAYSGSGTSYTDIYNNQTPSMNCQGSGSYIPALTDRRRIVVQFNDGSGTGWQTLPAVDVNSVPYANYASDSQKFSGKVVSDFVLSSVFPLSACTTGQFLTYSGGALTCATPAGGGGSGTVTNVTSANSFLTIANGTTTPALTVNVGTAANTLAAGNDTRITGAAQKASNLSDLASVSTARTNLGSTTTGDALFTAATVTAARTTLGLGTAALLNSGTAATNLVQLDVSAKIPVALLPNIDAGLITSGTIDAARLPTSAAFWNDAGSGKINYNGGNVGIGKSAPTSLLHLNAGTAAAGTSPLKLTAGTNLTTAEAGAIEFDGTNLFYTDSTPARRTIATTSGGGSFTGVTSIANSGGNISLSPNSTTGSVLVTSNTASTGASNGALVVNGGVGVGGSIYATSSINAGTTITAMTSILTPQLYGSASASGNIKIDGTSNATKGNVLLASAGGKVGIGTTNPNGFLEIKGGSSAAGDAADINITGQNGPVGDTGRGGTTTISAGRATATGGDGAVGGDIYLSAGNGAWSSGATRYDSMGGSTYIAAGSGGDGGHGGEIKLNAGTGGTTAGSGGNVTISAGRPGSANESGGMVTLRAGAPIVGSGSDILIEASSAQTSAGANYKGGGVVIKSGWGAGPSAIGGDVTIDANLGNILMTGKVGVGIQAPTAQFHVANATADGHILSQTSLDSALSAGGVLSLARSRGSIITPTAIQTADNLGRVYFSAYDSAVWKAGSIIQSSAEENWASAKHGSNLSFSTTAPVTNSLQQQMIITGSGNVGIGTNSPAAKLEVNGPAIFGDGVSGQQYLTVHGASASTSIADYAGNSAGLELVNTNATNNNFTSIAFRNAVGALSAKIVGINSTHTASFDGQLSFVTAKAGTITEAMRIAGNGNVGIGTSTPTAVLNIVAAGNLNNAGTIDATQASLLIGTTTNGIAFDNNQIERISSVADPLYINYNSNNNIVMAYGGGNVGIGTNFSPSYKLDVQGGGVNASGGYTQTSDIRLKTNVEFIDANDSLNRITTLRGIYYDWKDQSKLGRDRQVGLIAQDVEKVFPQAVKTNTEGFLSVSYSNLVAPVIEAIKSLHRQMLNLDEKFETQSRMIASVQAENSELKKENAAIKARLEKIERKLDFN